MKNSDELRDELNDSPFLKKIKDKPGEGFQVPKHYFQHLPDEVLQRVKPVAEPTPSRPNWLDSIAMFLQGLLQPRYALAFASVAVLVVAGIVFLRDKNAGTTLPGMAQVRLEDVSDEELFAYVADNIGDFDHEMVVEVGESELPALPKPKKPSFQINVPKPEVEEMEEYLDEVIDEVDVEDLEELL